MVKEKKRYKKSVRILMSKDNDNQGPKDPKIIKGPWLDENQYQATLKGSKAQALKVLESFRMKKIYKDKINKQFKI